MRAKGGRLAPHPVRSQPAHRKAATRRFACVATLGGKSVTRSNPPIAPLAAALQFRAQSFRIEKCHSCDLPLTTSK
jgi:hypothetical protein